MTGNSRKILRAEPETFIHIFVHKQSKLIEFLEHMTKVHHAKLALYILHHNRNSRPTIVQLIKTTSSGQKWFLLYPIPPLP